MILDIGCQDSKAIALTEKGRVKKFEMNDRCAAGTGKFLEIMASALGFSLQDFGAEALQAEKSLKDVKRIVDLLSQPAVSIVPCFDLLQNSFYHVYYLLSDELFVD